MASIFPEIETTETSQNNNQIAVTTYGKELAFDFENEDFIMEDGSPKVVEGLEALKVWIEKAIRTARYRFPAYTFNYGCEFEEIIGYDIPKPVLESEVRRVVREALIYDNRIEDVRNFSIERGEDWLRVSFRVVTVLGDSFEQEVAA